MRTEVRTIVQRGTLTLFAVLVAGIAAGQGVEKRITASDAWVKLPAPGETQTLAFVNFENPTMYDVYLKSAAADAAGKVELRDASLSGDRALKPVEFVTVPAHDWAYMDPKGTHLLLMDLKRPLKEGDTVIVTVKTEIGDELGVPAVVKKQ